MTRRRLLIPLMALLAWLALLYAPIVGRLIAEWWDDPNYSHGFLVPVFAGYLIWQRRGALAALQAPGNWLGLPVLLGGLAMLVLGEIGAERFLAAMSLIVVLAGLVLFHLGRAWFRPIAFPLAYLTFMVPLPAILFYAVAFPLQQLAARNAAWTLDALGVPVLLDGNVLQLANLTLGVTEACSGIRSLVSMLAVAVAWGYLTLPGFWSSALLVASVVPITVVANAGRVVATGLIGQYAGVEYATGVFHTFSGWVIFVIAFIGLLGVHGVIQLVQGRRRPGGVGAPAAARGTPGVGTGSGARPL
jgi:exosortase